MLQSDRYWSNTCRHLGLPGLVDDPRFVHSAARASNSAACVAALDEAFGRRTLAEWTEAFGTLQVQWAAVQTPAELHHDPRVALACSCVPSPTRQVTNLARTSPLQFGDQDVCLRRSAPASGEHTDEVLLRARAFLG